MPHNGRWPAHHKFVGQIVSLLIIGSYVNFSLSQQTHRGSSPTNEFLVNGRTPDAYIQVDSGNKNVIIINIQAPPLSPGQPPYKVGLELVAMQLCDVDDRLKIVYSDSHSIRTVTWKLNATLPSHPREQLVDLQANQIVLIPEGKWAMASAVSLVATLYQDSMEDGSCPENTVPCSCSSSPHKPELASTSRFSAETETSSTSYEDEEASLSEEDIQNQNTTVFQEVKKRCIPRILVCNGKANCGLACNYDEAPSTCSGLTYTPPTSSFPIVSSCVQTITTTERNTESGSLSRMISSAATIALCASIAMLFNTV
ncbi:unnamed protein product [Orchesella dallaii]|uniref:Uncharacterized protein n=1 Tax=Orchesella dallaii TaxID=48710 RepID=A0ABP1RG71_9HEXA